MKPVFIIILWRVSCVVQMDDLCENYFALDLGSQIVFLHDK